MRRLIGLECSFVQKVCHTVCLLFKGNAWAEQKSSITPVTMWAALGLTVNLAQQGGAAACTSNEALMFQNLNSKA